MKKIAQAFNHRWRAEEHDGGQDPAEEGEVMVYGEVELYSNERDLLSLGPSFMVISQLDDQEMKVESAVTMTKIRWSRRKQGTDNMRNRSSCCPQKRSPASVKPWNQRPETCCHQVALT